MLWSVVEVSTKRSQRELYVAGSSSTPARAPRFLCRLAFPKG